MTGIYFFRSQLARQAGMIALPRDNAELIEDPVTAHAAQVLHPGHSSNGIEPNWVTPGLEGHSYLK